MAVAKSDGVGVADALSVGVGVAVPALGSGDMLLPRLGLPLRDKPPAARLAEPQLLPVGREDTDALGEALAQREGAQVSVAAGVAQDDALAQADALGCNEKEPLADALPLPAVALGVSAVLPVSEAPHVGDAAGLTVVLPLGEPVAESVTVAHAVDVRDAAGVALPLGVPDAAALLLPHTDGSAELVSCALAVCELMALVEGGAVRAAVCVAAPVEESSQLGDAVPLNEAQGVCEPPPPLVVGRTELDAEVLADTEGEGLMEGLPELEAVSD